MISTMPVNSIMGVGASPVVISTTSTISSRGREPTLTYIHHLHHFHQERKVRANFGVISTFPQRGTGYLSSDSTFFYHSSRGGVEANSEVISTNSTIYTGVLGGNSEVISTREWAATFPHHIFQQFQHCHQGCGGRIRSDFYHFHNFPRGWGVTLMLFPQFQTRI